MFRSHFFAGDRHFLGSASGPFQCPHGLELLLKLQLRLSLEMLSQCPNGIELLQEAPSANPNGFMFQCPNGLELLRYVLDQQELMRTGFNALTGLSCYLQESTLSGKISCFNALMGLSCYRKNVQYFKFFMILFMYPCYLFIGVY